MLISLFKIGKGLERVNTLSRKIIAVNYGVEDKVILSKYPPVVKNCTIL